jgi:hypothetical protein
MFNLSAQVVVSCIGKVADAYKLDRKTKRSFRPKGSIALMTAAFFLSKMVESPFGLLKAG